MSGFADDSVCEKRRGDRRPAYVLLVHGYFSQDFLAGTAVAKHPRLEVYVEL
jgi:hypothetical protein